LSLRLVLGLERRQVPLKGKCLHASALRTSRRRTLCKKRPATVQKHISFSPVVSVTEFTRCLDGGGTIPGDGSKVTLGLGKPHRRLTVPLAPCQDNGAVPIEERAWLPTPQRVRLLRAAMGDAKYFHSWRRHRRDWHHICKSRQQSNADAQDQLLMPTSYTEACKRARALSRETSRWHRRRLPAVRSAQTQRNVVVQRRRSSGATAERKCAHSRGKSKDHCGKAALKAVPQRSVKLKQRPPLYSPTPDGKQLGAKSRGEIRSLATGIDCHFCSRPIGFGAPELRCTCLKSNAGARFLPPAGIESAL